jgi:hypothetical protein
MFIHDVKTNNKNIQFKKYAVFVLINAEKEFSVPVIRDRKAYVLHAATGNPYKNDP